MNHVIRAFKHSKNNKVFHFGFSAFLVIFNLWLLRGLFSAGSEYMDANSLYAIILVFVLAVIFLVLIFMAPMAFRRNEKGRYIHKGIAQKILSIWVPLSFYLLIQMVILAVCNLLSPYFDLPIYNVVFTALGLFAVLFLWAAICVIVYYLWQNIGGYILGIAVINLAPSLIVLSCFDIYNSNLLIYGSSENPLSYNIFLISGLLAGVKPIIFLLCFGVVFGIFALLHKKAKNFSKTAVAKLFTPYKIAIILLSSVTIGFIAGRLITGDANPTIKYILTCLISALVFAVFWTWFAFRKNKPIIKTAVVFVATITALSLALFAIPAKSQKDANFLPDYNDVEKVEIFLDSMEDFETDAHFDECVELHGDLLRLLDANPPKECDLAGHNGGRLAERWEDFKVSYHLKNGECVHRSYRDLCDDVYDDFYIKLLQSDFYAHALKQTKMDNPEMRYRSFGGDEMGDWCELPAESVNNLINTYCEELKNAERKAFYEECETIRLTGVYGYDDRIIYLPYSFTETRAKAQQYIETYKNY